MLPDELKPEYWHKFFSDQGFEPDHEYMLSDDGSRVWYSCGNFKVGYNSWDLNHMVSPAMRISYLVGVSSEKKPLNIDIRIISKELPFGRLAIQRNDSSGHFFIIPGVTLSEFRHVVENMMVPEKLPLLVGIEWASELVSVLLEGGV